LRAGTQNANGIVGGKMTVNPNTAYVVGTLVADGASVGGTGVSLGGTGVSTGMTNVLVGVKLAGKMTVG
jgi:hypothetical protein